MKFLTSNKKNKYNAKKTSYNGEIYDSSKEANKAWELDQLTKNNYISGYRAHVAEDLYGRNGTKVTACEVDFVLEHKDGTKEFLEIKSSITKTPTWRLKWKLLKDKYLNDKNYKFTVEE